MDICKTAQETSAGVGRKHSASALHWVQGLQVPPPNSARSIFPSPSNPRGTAGSSGAAALPNGNTQQPQPNAAGAANLTSLRLNALFQKGNYRKSEKIFRKKLEGVTKRVGSSKAYLEALHGDIRARMQPWLVDVTRQKGGKHCRKGGFEREKVRPYIAETVLK